VTIRSGNDITIYDSYAYLHPTGNLTFSSPASKFILEHAIFRIGKDHTANYQIETKATGLGSRLDIDAGTTTTLNGNVIGNNPLINIGSGSIVLNAAASNDINLSGGGNFSLGSSGSVAGDVLGAAAANQTFSIAGTVAGDLNTNTGTNTINIPAGGSVNSIVGNVGGSDNITLGGTSGAITVYNNSSVITETGSQVLGALNANDNTNVTLGSSPTGIVTIGTGILTIAGNTVVSSDIIMGLGSSLVYTNDGSEITGNITFNQDTALTDAKITSVTIGANNVLTLKDSEIRPGGSVIGLAGAGTKIVLDGTNLSTKNTNVPNNQSTIELTNGATFYATDNADCSNIDINNFSANSLDLVTGSTSPSSSIPALTIANYNAFDPGNEGTLIVGINPGVGQRTQWLNVLGNIDITDSKIVVVTSKSSSFKNVPYNVIEYGGARTGEFTTLEIQTADRQIISGLLAEADYDSVPGKVGITFVASSTFSTDLQATFNQNNIINALNGSNNSYLQDLDWNVRTSDSGTAKSMLDLSGPEGYHMLYHTDLIQAQNFDEEVYKHNKERLISWRKLKTGLWLTTHARRHTTENSGDFYGSRGNNFGITGGFDKKHVRYNMLMGLAYGASKSSDKSNLNIEDKVDRFQLGSYFYSMNPNNTFINLQANFSHNQHYALRTMHIKDYDEKWSLKGKSYVISADARLGKHLSDGFGYEHKPYIVYSGKWQRNNAVSETGETELQQALALNIDRQKRFHSYLGLGSDIKPTNFISIWGNYNLQPTMDWQYLTRLNDQALGHLDSYFAGDIANKFEIQGLKPGRHSARLGLGLKGLGIAARSKGHSFTANYNAKLYNYKEIHHAFNINYQWKW
jgi:hypothetical protein